MVLLVAGCSYVLTGKKFRVMFRAGVNPQDVHVGAVSRLGGLAIMFGFILHLVLTVRDLQDLVAMPNVVILLGSLIFSIGLADDISGHVDQKARLLLTGIVALLYGVFVGWIDHIDLFTDSVLGDARFIIFPALTIFSIVGITNAFNIVDGLNGLSSGIAIIIFLGIAFLCGTEGLMGLRDMALIATALSFGFWIVNFPKGHITLGDGGAYLLGFLVTDLCIRANNLGTQVSSWSYLLLCGYPIVETLFSVVRRLKSGKSWSDPDQQHLHQLVLKFLRINYPRLASEDWRLNSLAASMCLAIASFSVVTALIFRNEPEFLIAGSGVFLLGYLVIYEALSKFASSAR